MFKALYGDLLFFHAPRFSFRIYVDMRYFSG